MTAAKFCFSYRPWILLHCKGKIGNNNVLFSEIKKKKKDNHNSSAVTVSSVLVELPRNTDDLSCTRNFFNYFQKRNLAYSQRKKGRKADSWGATTFMISFLTEITI